MQTSSWNMGCYRAFTGGCYAAFLCAALLLAGCSHQDFNRGMGGAITDVVDSGRSYVPQGGDAAPLERARRLAKALADWRMEASVSPNEYHIGPEDILEVNVLSLHEPGQTSKLLRTVAYDGTILLPWVGRITASGTKVADLEETIRTAYAGKYIKDPQVTVVISQYRSAPVVVTGAVAKPGVYYLTRDRRSLLEILAEADGLSASAGDELMIIRKGSERRTNGNALSSSNSISLSVFTNAAANPPVTNELTDAAAGVTNNPENLLVVDLRRLIDDGDLSLNVLVAGGDLITVLPRQKNFIYVLGYVMRPGSYEYSEGRKVGPMQYVAMAGGLSATARAENCFLIRDTRQGQQIIPFDLTKIARGVRPSFGMEPGDTLVVGSSFLAKLSEFVRPSIGAGVSYAPGAP